MRRGLALLLELGCAAVMAASAAAQPAGDPVRRAAAELLILEGDARLLQDADLPRRRQEGLRARLRGGLASLGIMVRRAAKPAPEAVGRLRAALDAADLPAFIAELETLQARLPLSVPGILPPRPTPARLARGRAIHRAICAGCHDAPDTGAALPARNLFEQASSAPVEEFAARLLLGVRGDSLTALANPFSDEDIAGLLVYYLQGVGPPHDNQVGPQ